MAVSALPAAYKPMKNINYVGTDIELVKRFKNSKHTGKEFFNKIFTSKEISYCNTKAYPEQHFAARFAAKEAVIKAVSKLEPVFYSDIEIINDKEGRPSVTLLKSTTNLKKENFSISISHTRDLAIAFVLYSKD